MCALFFFPNIKGKQDVQENKSKVDTGERSSDDMRIDPKDQNNHVGEEQDNLDRDTDKEGGKDDDEDEEEDEAGDEVGDEEVNFDLEELDPEEAKKKLSVMFVKVDSNADGNIDRKELVASAINSYKNIESGEFNNTDADHDGFLTLKEIVDNSEYSEYSDMKIFLFPFADKDGDGKLNVTDFVLINRPNVYPAMRPHLLAWYLKDMDTDGNGKLSLKEYLKSQTHNYGTGDEKLSWYKKLFHKRLDKNGDESLDGEEILAWRGLRSLEEGATAEADRIISDTDKDEDKLLSFDEVFAKYYYILHSNVFIWENN